VSDHVAICMNQTSMFLSPVASILCLDWISHETSRVIPQELLEGLEFSNGLGLGFLP